MGTVSGLWYFFFIKSEKYMSVIVTSHNIHVIVLYYQNWLQLSGKKFENL